MVWTVRKKILLAVLLGIIAWALFGQTDLPDEDFQRKEDCSYEQLAGDTDVFFLRREFIIFNNEYFHDKLPHDTTIDTELNNSPNQAETYCVNDDGSDCNISFNLHYTAAPRNAKTVLLHEMCHIKVWSKNLEVDRPPMMLKLEYDHNPDWKGCMVGIDMHDAFRKILIDFYRKEDY